MHPVLFIALPLLTAFLVAPLLKISIFKKGWLPTILLGGISLYAGYMLPMVLQAPISELVVIKAPLGINLYAGPFAILMIMATSIFAMVLTSSPKLRSQFSDNAAANVLALLHFAGIYGLFLSGDLFNIFVFLEIASLSAIALTTLSDSTKSIEAAIKYLLAGAIASIFLLVGIALTYFHTGTLNLAEIAVLAPTIPLAAKGIILTTLLISFSIEAELFPFNFWVPDVYEGSGAALSGLFSSMTLKAMLYLVFRFIVIFAIDSSLQSLVLWAGLLSMIVAELGALKQNNVVRMLAYSSMAQAGIIVAGFMAGAESATVFHMLSHSAAKAGLFLIASLAFTLSGKATLESLRGIGYKNRFVGITATILILSLLGLPPFSGFIGKLLILQAILLKAGIFAVILVLIASLIEAWYLLKLLAIIFDKNDKESVVVPWGLAIPLTLPLVFIVVAGIIPRPILALTTIAGDDLNNKAAYVDNVLGTPEPAAQQVEVMVEQSVVQAQAVAPNGDTVIVEFETTQTIAISNGVVAQQISVQETIVKADSDTDSISGQQAPQEPSTDSASERSN